MAGSDLLLAGVLFLFAAVIAVPLASRLGIGAVLGYLLAGIAIGPWGLGFISHGSGGHCSQRRYPPGPGRLCRGLSHLSHTSLNQCCSLSRG